MPAATVVGKDSVTVWLLPEAKINGEAGVVVAPAGRPESVTVVDPVKPFCPVIEVVKVVLDVPAAAVMALGDSAIAKSGAALTVSVSAVECVSDPEIALAVTV